MSIVFFVLEDSWDEKLCHRLWRVRQDVEDTSEGFHCEDG